MFREARKEKEYSEDGRRREPWDADIREWKRKWERGKERKRKVEKDRRKKKNRKGEKMAKRRQTGERRKTSRNERGKTRQKKQTTLANNRKRPRTGLSLRELHKRGKTFEVTP